MEKKKRRHFPDEFKRQAVERVETRGLPLFEVAAELGVHGSQLCRWSRQFGQAGALTTRHRPSREVPEPSPADLVAEIALEALAMAIRRQRPEPGLLHHSDRGVQYAAEDDRQALAKARIIPSMSRKGNCLDNAPMESFFHTLKVERAHTRIDATRTEARRDLFAYIEGVYNSRRLHSAIG